MVNFKKKLSKIVFGQYIPPYKPSVDLSEEIKLAQQILDVLKNESAYDEYDGPVPEAVERAYYS